MSSFLSAVYSTTVGLSYDLSSALYNYVADKWGVSKVSDIPTLCSSNVVQAIATKTVIEIASDLPSDLIKSPLKSKVASILWAGANTTVGKVVIVVVAVVCGKKLYHYFFIAPPEKVKQPVRLQLGATPSGEPI